MDVTIDCPCPTRDGETRHPNGDTIKLRESLDFRSITAIRHGASLVENDGSALYTAELLAVLTEGYVIFGIESWTLVDEKGKPVEVTRTAIRERVLSDVVAAAVVGDAADELYSKAVMLPLLNRASRSSQPTSTDDSTSPPTGSPASRPKPSKRSSTITSRMDGIEATSLSLAGVSSSSQSSGTEA